MKKWKGLKIVDNVGMETTHLYFKTISEAIFDNIRMKIIHPFFKTICLKFPLKSLCGTSSVLFYENKKK